MRRRYVYYIAEGTKRCFYTILRETTQDNCDICKASSSACNHSTPINIRNLIKANLNRHLKTGKHWKVVWTSTYVCK